MYGTADAAGIGPTQPQAPGLSSMLQEIHIKIAAMRDRITVLADKIGGAEIKQTVTSSIASQSENLPLKGLALRVDSLISSIHAEIDRLERHI